jgi:ArsR family transcriptional regulator
MPKTTPTVSLGVDKAAELFNGFADPTRLRLLSLIAHCKEICVCDLENVTKLPQARISRHLANLRHSDLVNTRRDGVWIYYSLKAPETPLQKSLLDAIRNAHHSVNQLAEDLETLRCVPCCSPQTVQIKLPK